jgi:UPF0755 protein
VRLLLLAVLLLVVLALGAGGWLALYAQQPVAPAQLPARFTLDPGIGLTQASRRMAEAGVIDHPLAFRLLGRALGHAARIKAGSYEVNRPLTPLDLFDMITRGVIARAQITVIEGWTFREMRAALNANPDLRHDTRALSDAELLARIDARENHPEGLFFPDTYVFDVGSGDLEVYRTAYRAMRERLDALWPARAPGLSYATPYQALIMASIVEKETGAASERPLIAAVFTNRLKIDMRLQTDPTVIYGLGERFDGNLRRRDLLDDTPYNSYTRAGLPPTPIALPGMASLRAALNPAASRAIYFVARGDGSHQFSDNLDDHNRAVARYQKGQ